MKLSPRIAVSSSETPLQPPHRRYRKDPRLAQLYEAEIAPLWTQRFGRLLLRELDLGPKATVLDVLCGTGFAALEVLRQVGDGVRVVAIDPSPAMLDQARQRAGAAAGRRVFFRTEAAEPALSFDSEVYDLVLSNLGLWDVAEPRRLLHEMVRVAKPGAQVRATMPLLGTFAEVHDLLAGILSARGLSEAERRLRAHISTLPSALEARSWLVEAGLGEVKVDCAPFTLLFGGGRELFFAPLIEYGPLPDWKEVVGPQELREVFSELVGAIDESLRTAPGEPPRPFSLTVRAACLSGRKPVCAPVAARPRPPTGAPEQHDPDSGVVELKTGEYDILSMVPAADPRKR